MRGPGSRSRPRSGSSCGPRTPSSCPYDCEGTRIHARRLAAAGLLTADELAEVEARLDRDRGRRHGAARARGRGRPLRDRAAARPGRAQDPRRAGRATTRSSTAFRLYVARRLRRGGRRDRRPRDRRSSTAPRPRPRRRCPATRTSSAPSRSPSATTCSPGSRCSSATARRFARRRGQADALAARRRRARRLDARPPAAARRDVRNSLDAVADRDFALDYLYACAALFVHLSRIGEELVLWATSEFGFARLPESAATGLVDDAAEAEPRRRRARARQGRHRDRPAHRAARDGEGAPALVQQRPRRRTSRRCSRARRDVRLALARARRARRAISSSTASRLAAAAADPLLRATDAAEALVADGVPFRDAHEQVAAQVRDGTFEAPPAAAIRRQPGPRGVAEALRAARGRLHESTGAASSD